MNKRVFVTGGSGFLGQHLIRLLHQNGYLVRALARSNASKEKIEKLNAEVVLGDILDIESFKRGLKDCDTLIHLAGVVSYRLIDRSRMRKVNIQGTLNAIHLVEELNIARFLYCSSVVALGGSNGELLDENRVHPSEFFSVYEKSKYAAHLKVLDLAKRRTGIYVVLPALAIGGGGEDILGVYMRAFCREKLPFLISMNNKVSYVAAADIAKGILLCLNKGRSGEQYILASDSASPDEFAAMLEKFSGSVSPRVKLKPGFAKPMLLLDELAASVTGRVPPLTLESLNVLISKSWVYSSQKAKTELGWEPMPISQAVQEAVQELV